MRLAFAGFPLFIEAKVKSPLCIRVTIKSKKTEEVQQNIRTTFPVNQAVYKLSWPQKKTGTTNTRAVVWHMSLKDRFSQEGRRRRRRIQESSTSTFMEIITFRPDREAYIPKAVSNQDSSCHQTFHQKSSGTMAVNSIIVPRSKKFDYVKPFEFKFEWSVCQRAIMEEDAPLQSETFSSGPNNELKWCIKLYPVGINNDEHEASLHVCFVTSTNNAKVRANLKLSMFNEDGIRLAVQEKSKAHTFVAGTASATARFEKFIQTASLEGMDYDCFRTVCEIKGVATTFDVPGKNEAVPLIMPEYRFPDKLRSLFETTKFSDVTLIVSGVDFKAHKVVLAIHSPVFSAMFDHGTVEEIHSEINIPDISPNVFKEVLRFMYTGEVTDIEKIADFLLVAADKYAIERLKAMCEETLCENMAVENAADILILADRHNADQLKPRALKFIAFLTSDVMATSGFQSMIQSHPHLVAEILSALTERRNDELHELTLPVIEEEPMQS